MQPRERVLVGIIIGLLVLVGGYWMTGGVTSHFADLKRRRDGLRGDLQSMDLQLAQGMQRAKRLQRWQEQSLPTDPTRAKSDYKSWLGELTAREGVKFSGTNVTSSPSRNMRGRGVYQKLPFIITGQGDLRQLTNFLYHFYQGNHLHKIANMNVKPVAESDKLDLTITIEALSLPGADRTNQLAEGVSDRLADNPLQDYVDAIVKRDLFAHYRRPEPPGPTQPGDPEIDPARFAFFSGVTESEGNSPLVWINLRTSGKVLKLGEGDDFSVSDQRYKILRIHSRSVEIESDGRRMSVAFGHNLLDAVELPDKTASR